MALALQEIISIASLGMIPRPNEIYPILHTIQPDQMFNRIVDQLDHKLNSDHGRLEHTNHFGSWIPSTYQQVRERLHDYIYTAYQNTLNRDAARGLAAVNLNWYSPVPHLSPYRLLLDVIVVEETRLGDGVVIFTRERNWQPSQIKGRYLSTKHCMMRQRTAL